MKQKEIIVEAFTDMVRALEILEAETVIIKGMIHCGRYRFSLYPGQRIVGFDNQSGLSFRYDKAQSAFLLPERSCLENLKIEVTAEKYPSKESMQAVVEANGYQSVLKNIFMDIRVKELKKESLMQYAGIYPRHEVLLSGNLHIYCRGHDIAPIADCPLATSRFVGNGVNLRLDGGKLEALRQLELRGENNVINIKTAAR